MHIVKFTIYKSHFLCWQIFLDWAQVKLVYVPWTNDFQFFLLLFDYSHPSFTCSLVLLPSTDLTLSVPESEVKVLVAQLCLDCLSLHGLQPTRLFCPWILQSGILEWVAMPFFRGSSQPRDQTWVSHIAGRFFTVWATREGSSLNGRYGRLGKKTQASLVDETPQ